MHLKSYSYNQNCPELFLPSVCSSPHSGCDPGLQGRSKGPAAPASMMPQVGPISRSPHPCPAWPWAPQTRLSYKTCPGLGPSLYPGRGSILGLGLPRNPPAALALMARAWHQPHGSPSVLREPLASTLPCQDPTSHHMQVNSPLFMPALVFCPLVSVIPHIRYTLVFHPSHHLILAQTNCTVHLKLLQANDKEMKINIFLSNEIHHATC